MDQNDERLLWVAVAVVLANAAIIGPIFTANSVRENAEREAVLVGAARWVPNADGSTRCEWIRKGE